MAWYIDSWSSRDGFAFISRREADTIESGETVFVSPPDFSPVPIANISTALAAARGHFQERFYSLRREDHGEVEFDTLEQAIEAIRRSYLKAGTQFFPPPSGDGLQGRSRNRDLPLWQGEEGDLGQHLKNIQKFYSFIDKEGARDQIAQELVKLCQVLRDKKDMERFAVHCLMVMMQQPPLVHDKDEYWEWRRDLYSLLAYLPLVGAWENWHDFEETMVEIMHGPSAIHDELYSLYNRYYRYMRHVGYSSLGAFQHNVSGPVLDGLLFRIAVNSRWGRDFMRTGPDTLGDNLMLACSDRKYLELMNDHLSMLPLLMAALIIVAPTFGNEPILFSDIYDRRHSDFLFEKAAKWLAQNLPGLQLKGHEMMDVITKTQT